jgi:cell division protein FtsQ
VRGVDSARAAGRRAGDRFGEIEWRRIRLWGLLSVCVLAVLCVIAWFTPALSVRTVRIEGAVAVPEQQVRDLLEIPSGRSMLRIDTNAVARRVVSIPKVRSARVQRIFPSTVRVSAPRCCTTTARKARTYWTPTASNSRSSPRRSACRSWSPVIPAAPTR